MPSVCRETASPSARTTLAGLPIIVWTLCTAATAERVFHSRDRSDIRVAHQATPIRAQHSAQKFLARYGWTKPVNWEDTSYQDAATATDEDPAPPDLMSLIHEDLQVSKQIDPSTSQDTESSAFIQALKSFQATNGLAVTGSLDPATREAMNTPRCGVPDQKSNPHLQSSHNATLAANGTDGKANQTHTVEVNATRGGLVRRKRFLHHHLFHGRRSRGRRREFADGSISGLAFRKRKLKWRLLSEGYSSQLSVPEQRDAIRLAFRLWSEVTPIDFEEDRRSSPSGMDITLAFGTGRHLGCPQTFDGAGQEVAHSWQSGTIHFDDDEHFTAPNSNQGISLLRVAVHEVGHVLGLPHIYGRGSIMQPNYSAAGRGTELVRTDRKAIQQLYGVCEGPFDTVFDWVRRERGPDGRLVMGFNTYFFRDSWYWMYENRNNRTRYGDPLAICSGWRGIPTAGIDAFVHVCTWSRDTAYFFKGTQYWRYDSVNDRAYTEDPRGVRYPKLISSGFPGMSGPIDAAFFDRRDQCIYFFQEGTVTAFNVNANTRMPGYPKRIVTVFPPLIPGDHPISNLDAVYYSYTHRSTFFVKGLYYWRVVNQRDRVTNPGVPHNALQPKRKVSEHWLDICNVHLSTMT
ncbi:matrix metalloproteinase-21-like [Scyliorhinus canicula]|uniref:matrix metalloproteinase-21-like n=1 Tax=Scyliorhinus canicula TaxID=7830 RepID=UPI0018F5E51E|nr:matrix metalloproteinase-21-like [Scyliorhinus canicula]